MSGTVSLSVIVIALTLPELSWTNSDTEKKMQVRQKRLLLEAESACRDLQKSEETPTDGVYCPRIFDNVMCWPITTNGTTARLNCPWYVQGFDATAYATKDCMADGQWFIHTEYNTSWSNYTMCPLKPHPYETHMPRMILISNIGYSISMSSLMLAVLIMVYFKRLHCSRNTIHINLFASLIFRAAACLLRFNHVDVAAIQLRAADSTNWDCKLVATIFMYTQIASYIWVFIEGLYLHILIFVSVFADKKHVCVYLSLFGWLFPCVFMIPWVIIRIYLEDVHCWMTHPNQFYYWIIVSPIIASIAVSFIFFLNILRVLFTKLMARNTNQTQRYRKLAKSTLVLIPLFGVYYVVFICMPAKLANVNADIIRLYIEMTLNSFQGFLVALLFCFLNGEVRAELTRHRYFICCKKSSHQRPSQTQVSYINGTQHRTSSSDKEQSDHLVSHERTNGFNQTAPEAIELRKLTDDDDTKEMNAR